MPVQNSGESPKPRVVERRKPPVQSTRLTEQRIATPSNDVAHPEDPTIDPQATPREQLQKIANWAPRPKSQEGLQAQAELFGDKGVEVFSKDQAEILKYSAELSKIRDLNNLPPDLPEELVDLIAKHKDAYVAFLRKEGKLETDFIEENTRTYNEEFAPAVAELKAKMEQGDFKDLPEYLGSGSISSTFRIEVSGKTYAAKFTRRATQQNFEIKPLLRAVGVPHTSQLVSYSFADGVVVMELMPGTDVTNFTPENAPYYSDEHIIQLIETVRALDARGIAVDPKPSNFMYDPEQGFSILDYHLNHGGDNRYPLSDQIMELRLGLTARKFNDPEFGTSDYQEKLKTLYIEQNKVYLPTMIRFLGILKEKYPDILADWQQRHSDPRRGVIKLIDRENIPDDPELAPYLKQLEEMGY